MIKKLMLASCLVMVIASCKNDTKETEQSSTEDVTAAFNAMLDDYYEEGLVLNPIMATMVGDNRYNDQFPNILSDEWNNAAKAYYEKFQKRVSEFNDNDLTETEKMTKAVLKWECDINLEGFNYGQDLRPIDQMWSPHLFVGQLASGASMQPFVTVEDYQNWLSRLDGYTDWLHSAEAKMRKGMELGNVLPKSLIVKVLPQLESATTTNLDEHLFYTPVKNMPDDFSDEDKAMLTEAYTEKLTQKVIPAYQSLHDFMSNEYMAAGRESSGINDIPNGEAFYNYMIKQFTTTTMTANEIHELGLSEVARIRSEMEKIKEEVGFTGTLTEFFDYVRENKELMPYNDPQQVIDNFYAIHERMIPQLEKLFDNKPKTPFEVRRVEAFREKTSAAHYNPGSLESDRPGIFYVPIPEVTQYNVHQDETLFLHEAIPGHHYQIAMTQENEELPDFRKNLFYSGYGEGWALYAESLGKELGLYTDPYQYFGTLAAEMHRAIRLVVDTGMHSKGWSREQAIQYSLDNESESEASIISEIERYMAMPGQALSYKIGQLKIRELRDKAQAEMGDNFDIGQFHNEILEVGCVPLALLEDKINKWIEDNK